MLASHFDLFSDFLNEEKQTELVTIEEEAEKLQQKEIDIWNLADEAVATLDQTTKFLWFVSLGMTTMLDQDFTRPAGMTFASYSALGVLAGSSIALLLAKLKLNKLAAPISMLRRKCKDLEDSLIAFEKSIRQILEEESRILNPPSDVENPPETAGSESAGSDTPSGTAGPQAPSGTADVKKGPITMRIDELKEIIKKVGETNVKPHHKLLNFVAFNALLFIISGPIGIYFHLCGKSIMNLIIKFRTKFFKF